MRRAVWVVMGAALGLVVAAGAWAARGLVAPAPDLHGMLLESPRPAADFTLQSAGGAEVRLSDFRGRLAVLYFGYTFCPDVCPATLADLARALDALGGQAQDVQVILVSIDPERDTPDRIAAYARAFRPDFLGLSGTPEEVAQAATTFGIFFEKAGGAGQGYLMNHTSTVTVVDRAGFVRLVWPYGVEPADIAADLRYLLSR